MAAKLKLTAEPTFKAKVGIPVPGASPAQVEFTFKHRTKTEVTAWWEALGDDDKADVAGVSECVLGWDLDDEFTPENVARLVDMYPGATGVIITAYLQELRGARTKN